MSNPFEPRPFHGHSANRAGCWETLAEHLSRVAHRARTYAAVFGADDEAAAVALLHDIGKYGDLFQDRLEGRANGIDHWSSGAWMALQEWRKLGVASAVAIQGHHIGLQAANEDRLADLDPAALTHRHPLGLRLSETRYEVLRQRLSSDGLAIPRLIRSIYAWDPADFVPAMLDLRMLYSVLVDADFVETEAHFETGPDGARGYRPEPPPLNATEAFGLVETRSTTLDAATRADGKTGMAASRTDLFRRCAECGEETPGLFTLTAPTGSGKTLAMLAFALRHAARYGHRRIVFVLPFLTIIEQTVRQLRELFESRFGPLYMAEHHSLAGSVSDGGERGDPDNENAVLRTRNLLAENWDAPLVVTTSVQCLESLFANRPASCRKLHRIAQSILLFDEVQTLPPRLAAPTLAALSRLSEQYGTTVVFSTATQPAFAHLEKEVVKAGGKGWAPREMVRDSPRLFSDMKSIRTLRVEWPPPNERLSFVQLADSLADKPQYLCVVNLKRHALALAGELRRRHVRGLLHLSTNMCPAHRERVLIAVRRRLIPGARKPCRLIATQCVEAGVDLDFPVVFRAFGPLDAIAQAAGRCNRHGLHPNACFRIFVPDDDGALYPGSAYEQAACVTQALLIERGCAGMDIWDPSLFGEYYRKLYDLTGAASMDAPGNEELLKALKAQDFAAVARLYRLIDKSAVNVVVPYDLEAYSKLRMEAESGILNRKWIGRARAHSISLYRPQLGTWERFMKPVRVGFGRWSDDWFVYTEKSHYDRRLLGLEKAPETWWIA